MLLKFRVANFRSLRDEQELSFVPPPDEPSGMTRELSLSDGKHLAVFPVLGLFGANASGKSNVIVALREMKKAVLTSYAGWTAHERIPREPFALDPKSGADSTFFEVDFVLPETRVRWTYGFELGDRRVESEWLHAYPKGRRQVWYDRDASRDQVYDFPGGRLRDRSRLAETTRPNALLLTRAANDNHPQLTPIHRWFQQNLWDVTPETEKKHRETYTAERLLNDEDRERIEELLRVADLGISEARVERKPGEQPKISLLHTSSSGEPVAIDWDRESFGTRSWFALLGPILLALDRGAVLLVDELDSSLHSKFAAEVVRLFQTPSVNTNGAQLLFTSHDASLLSLPRGGRLLDPGQIWLTEKDRDGSTELYPLADIDPGEEEDLSDSYLAGAFGGVPRLPAGKIGRSLRLTEDIQDARERDAMEAGNS
ncbi:AAA family ATPase [Streptomyces spirodelae]|uniref:ATP-binding protein n=1 Tax=Streptomyces spirodelae TaxID=2812904 RepID=A0ABS3WUG0_9ACTN|nr:ATP-binding protein [Streptomyces spirodelae]MBO8186737.1 ATP-binding protein [Streptomyces spirodelae]